MGSIIAILQSTASSIVDGASDYSLSKDMMMKLYSMNKKQVPKVDNNSDLMDKLSLSKTTLLEKLKGR